MLIDYFTKTMVSRDMDSTNAAWCQKIHGGLFSSRLSLEAAHAKDLVLQQFLIATGASVVWACASGPLQQSFRASLSRFSGNSFSLLLLVSFLPFFGILYFIIWGPLSQNILLASPEPPPLFCLCIWHYLGSTLSPPVQHAFIGCGAGARSWLLESSDFSQTGCCNRSGIVLTREEEHVRFEFGKEIDVFPLPSLPRH